MRGEDGNSLNVPPRLFGAGTGLERIVIVVRAPSDAMSRVKIPSTTVSVLDEEAAAAVLPVGVRPRARKTTIPDELMAGWLYELNFATVPGTVTELFTMVVH